MFVLTDYGQIREDFTVPILAFEGWIPVFTGLNLIRLTMQYVMFTSICWLALYPIGSVTHPLQNNLRTSPALFYHVYLLHARVNDPSC